MAGCVNVVSECVVRGDIWPFDVGLGPEWEEVVADPAGYLGTIIFREEHDDSLPVNLQLTAVPQLVNPPTDAGAAVYLEFNATSAETQALPDYDLVGYCEIAPISDLSQSRRLFNMRIDIHD